MDEHQHRSFWVRGNLAKEYIPGETRFWHRQKWICRRGINAVVPLTTCAITHFAAARQTNRQRHHGKQPDDAMSAKQTNIKGVHRPPPVPIPKNHPTQLRIDQNRQIATSDCAITGYIPG